MEYSPKQQEAIAASCDLTRRLVAVTGKAGRGKTLILHDVYHQLHAAGYKIALCAPTGKAARRIKEATGLPAQTIHKMLEYSFPGERHPKTGKPMGTSRPKRDIDNKLDYDVILGDEWAMVNQQTSRDLYDAMKPGSALRCFGDINQLKPIENKAMQDRPSPFQDILRKFKGIELDTNFRQEEDSGIAVNADRILEGRTPKANNEWTTNFTSLSIDALKDYILMHDDYDFSGLDHQIITPTKVGWLGTAKLNNLLQGIYRSELGSKEFMTVPRHTWIKTGMRVAVGDKVINTQNTYKTPTSELECFNGEVGIVTQIWHDIGVIDIDMGDRVVSFPPVITFTTNKGEPKQFDPRRNLDLAYALTTHKMQGSEVKSVVYLMGKGQYFALQNRANFYTAVTRAREHVHTILDQSSLRNALTNRGQ
jgi:exodeoxyribonuclease V alpha subunit